jgi:hypothetical protein
MRDWHLFCGSCRLDSIIPHPRARQLNLRQLVELTGIISAHSPNLIAAPQPIAREAVLRYLHCSDARAADWIMALDDYPRQIAATPAGRRNFVRRSAEAMLVDVIAGGMIARVWGAVLTARDRSRRECFGEQAARNVLSRQMQAQQAVLRLLVEGNHLAIERVVRIDRLRRTIERWTDLWLGHLIRRYALADFAYDFERATDFGEEQLRESWEPRRQQIWGLYFLCVRSSFPDSRLPGGKQGPLRRAQFQSILASFPADMFLDDGPLKSVRLQQLLRAQPEGPPRGQFLRFAVDGGRVKPIG